MLKIQLIRVSDAGTNVDDVRSAYILTISRVPCIGEIICSQGTTGKDGTREAGCYKVTNVMHHTGVKTKDGIVAIINAEYVDV